MASVDFLHHENPSTWAGVEPATLGTEGLRQTNHATQPSTIENLNTEITTPKTRDVATAVISRINVIRGPQAKEAPTCCVNPPGFHPGHQD
ncbi:hypothetical protein TNCV_2896891 [Trichonephila clavipes]|nr:hypothetical protein TNCV_2896891 [Trichonephila clavipes]